MADDIKIKVWIDTQDQKNKKRFKELLQSLIAEKKKVEKELEGIALKPKGKFLKEKQVEESIKAIKKLRKEVEKFNELKVKPKEKYLDLKEIKASIQHLQRLEQRLSILSQANPGIFNKLSVTFKNVGKSVSGFSASLTSIIAPAGKAVASIQKLEVKMEAVNTPVKKAGGIFDSIKKGISGFGKGVFGAVGLGIQGAEELGKKVIEATVKFEKLEGSIAKSIGDNSRAKHAFEAVKDFAVHTPFDIEEVTQSFNTLASSGFVPAQEEMNRLGELAAKQGIGIAEAANAVVEGQQGNLEALKQLGINAAVSGDQVVLSYDGVSQTVANNAEAIHQAVLSYGELEGVQGSMAEQNKSLGSGIQNLSESFDTVFAAVGEKLAPVLSGLIDIIIDVVDNMDPVIEAMSSVFDVVGDVFSAIGDLIINFTGAGDQGNALKGVMEFLGKAIEITTLPFKLFAKSLTLVYHGVGYLLNKAKELANFFGADFKIDHSFADKMKEDMEGIGETVSSTFSRSKESVKELTEEQRRQIEEYQKFVDKNRDMSQALTAEEEKRLANAKKLSVEEIEQIREYQKLVNKGRKETHKLDAAELQELENKKQEIRNKAREKDQKAYEKHLKEQRKMHEKFSKAIEDYENDTEGKTLLEKIDIENRKLEETLKRLESQKTKGDTAEGRQLNSDIEKLMQIEREKSARQVAEYEKQLTDEIAGYKLDKLARSAAAEKATLQDKINYQNALAEDDIANLRANLTVGDQLSEKEKERNALILDRIADREKERDAANQELKAADATARLDANIDASTQKLQEAQAAISQAYENGELSKYDMLVQTKALEEQAMQDKIKFIDEVLAKEELSAEQVNKLQQEKSALQDDLDASRAQSISKFNAELEGVEAKVNKSMGYINQANDIANAIHDAKMTKLDAEKKKELSNANLTAQEKEQIEAKYAKQQEELEKQAFERNKRLKLLQVIIETAVGVTKAIAANPVTLGAPQSVIVLAMGAAQAAQIAAQKYAQGGLLQGPSHAEGGIKYNMGGRVIELEGGEFVVNKRSTAAFMPALQAINSTRFADGGLVARQLDRSMQQQMSLEPVVSAIRDNLTVSIVDINQAQKRVSSAAAKRKL